MGYTNLVRMLLQASVECQSSRRRVWKHSPSNFILRMGINSPNSPTGWKYGNALLGAAYVGYEKVVQPFKSQAGVNTEWPTPLHTEPKLKNIPVIF
jgi:hypothetical protein